MNHGGKHWRQLMRENLRCDHCFFSVSHLSIGWSGFDFWTKSQSCTSAFWIETEENHSLLSNDIQAIFFPEKQIFPVIDTKSKKQCLHENWTRPAPTGFILKASSFCSRFKFTISLYNHNHDREAFECTYQYLNENHQIFIVHVMLFILYFIFFFFCLSSHPPSCMHIFVWF